MADKEVHDAAVAISKEVNRGRTLTLEVARDASEGMAKMLKNIKSKEAKIEALKHHAFQIGVGEGLDQAISTTDEMRATLTELTGSENEAGVLTDLWLAKIVIGLKTVLDKEHE